MYKGYRIKINGNIVFCSVLISFVCLIFFGNLTNVFIEFLEICGYSSILGSLEIGSFGIYLVYVLTACIAPAICEEFLFRGVIASGLKEKGINIDVEEDGQTFEENAIKKAVSIYELTGEAVVADDSGLQIDYFEGWPGVYTHRFIPSSTAEERNEAILEKMAKKT